MTQANAHAPSGITHAGDGQGQTWCGDVTPGRTLVNVADYPERWYFVTCVRCAETRR